MARRHVMHEEHANHEAWAIPYGDLVTLLLAFFVVMYAVSSVNEGKYRVMADAMSAAFGGTQHAMAPVKLSEEPQQGSQSPSLVKLNLGTTSPVNLARESAVTPLPAAPNASTQQLNEIGTRVESALGELVAQHLVNVRRGPDFLQIEIQSDLLFASGSALPSPAAMHAIGRLADVLRIEPNAVRVEGYTDDRPIHNAQFNSNWELSAARAASVVHVLADRGMPQDRLAVLGYGEFQPIADNATDAGRNANRRVQLVVMAATRPAGLEPAPAVVAEHQSANAPVLSAGMVGGAAVTAAGGP